MDLIEAAEQGNPNYGENRQGIRRFN